MNLCKAGIVCKLSTRCAVVAACNPRGHYHTDEPLAANVALGTPLLSRFDLIFILLDSKNKSWDKLVSSYILHGAANAKKSKTRWTIEKLQMYIGLVGPRCTEMTKSANVILQSYYMLQRKSQNRDPSRTTVRMLDSLVRLSQAHCRLMYRTTILPVDAIMAISLVDLSMQDCTLNDTMDALHSTFQKYPDFDYLCTAKTLLDKLNLNQIWKDELLYYAKLLKTDHKTLEINIEKGCTKLFSKYDEVIDDNIPLSCSLITSTYFKKDEKPNHSESTKKENYTEKEVINTKLAATLRKHATLNKGEDKLPDTRKTRKRKRKEITADVSAVVKNKPKFSKKNKREESEEYDTILNAVPSVNDIDLNNYEIDTIETQNNIENDSEHNVKDKGHLKANESTNTESKSSSKTLNFLKQFQYVKKDPNKSEEDVKDNEIVLLSSIKKESNQTITSVNKPTSSSQISIFETDCDIDLDL